MIVLNTTTTYTHKDEGGKYRILFINPMLLPNTNEWIPAVTYQSIQDNRIWTREYSSFKNNFVDIYSLDNNSNIGIN